MILEVVGGFPEARNRGPRVNAVAEQDLQDVVDTILAGPRVLAADVVGAGHDSLLDMVRGEDRQPVESHAVGEHLAAGRGDLDGLTDCREQRPDLVVREPCVDTAHDAAGVAILIAESLGHGGAQCSTIHALEVLRIGEHPGEDRATEVPLLHRPRVVGGRRGGDPGEKFR